LQEIQLEFKDAPKLSTVKLEVHPIEVLGFEIELASKGEFI
jgi:hypothetical protein